MRIRVLIASALLLFSTQAFAQFAQTDPEYLEQMYGPVIDVTLNELGFSPESYTNKAIRVKGRIGIQGIQGTSFELSDGGTRVIIAPIRQGMGEDQMVTLGGQMVEVVGLFSSSAGQGAGQGGATATSVGYIQFWRWAGPPEKVDKNKAAVLSLEQLVSRAGKMDGQLIRVVGKFRGRNLFADLPAKSMRTVNDWVIKDSLFAVWVTNKKPKGDGFDLDPSVRRDTNRWVEVIGRAVTKAGVVIIDAAQVALTTPPTPKADAAPPPPPPERPKIPPVIVFSLPLDGESDFDFSGRIIVQFNNDMDEDSFKGRVGLRYEGSPLPGDPGFESMRVRYDPGNKALVVDPGAPILRGRVLNLVLLTGIIDIDGQPLLRRDGKPAQNDVAEMLRFR